MNEFENWWKKGNGRGKSAEKQLAKNAWQAASRTTKSPESGVIRGVVAGRLTLDEAIDEVERKVILAALEDTYDNRVQAAELLGVSRSRLYRRMDALGI